MKWCLLILIGFLAMAFWPQPGTPKATPASQALASSRSDRPDSSRRPIPVLVGSRLTAIADKDLQAMITARWPAIQHDLPARDPSVVEFIRILREMGRRDGPEALAFLDELDRTDKEAAWIMARMAVAGGWSLSDPEAAALALLEDGHVFPLVRLGNISRSYSGLPAPLYLAIKKAAAQIFGAWVALSPDNAKSVAEDLVEQGAPWNFGILSQLTHLALPDWNGSNHSSLAAVDRNSIDAILNNPNHTVSSTFIVQLDKLPTEQMKSLGEPASTQAEWAARNPSHAIDLIQQSVNESEALEPQLIRGMARDNPNYQELHTLAPPSQKMEVAGLLVSMSRPDSNEMVWQLDGRETTWTLSVDQRQQAAQELVESGSFTDDEKAALLLLSKAAPYSIPELPNQTKRPD
ncbi:hypothetical protein V2O64_20090 [Verrucomicrobiaceae bacterium 227]